MSFGERLTKARNEKRLTQAELGKGLGTDGVDVAKSVVYGWERRGHFPRADQLVPICERLGVSADYLVRGIAPVWPFSAQLQQRVLELEAEDVERLENAMRLHLRMPLIQDRHTDERLTNAAHESKAKANQSGKLVKGN